LAINSVVEVCRTLALPVAADLGLVLYDVRLVRESGRLILRYVIDHEDGITFTHCELFSKRIDPVLDTHDPIPASYYLEVSSPGAERELRTTEEFLRFVGSPVQVKYYVNSKEENDTNENRVIHMIVARLQEATENGIKLQNNTQEVELKYDDIFKANILIEAHYAQLTANRKRSKGGVSKKR
jgi:ribosome maturation factor RimP